MAAVMVLMLIATSFLVGTYTNLAVAHDYGQQAAAEVMHVGGKVFCQDCSKGWNEWVHGDKPLKGCKVSLTCMDQRRRIIHYGSDITDELGQYDIIVNKYINGKELNTNSCWVRLVSSPDPACNILTDFSGGKSGVKLTRPNSIYRDAVNYKLDPFFFTTPMCDKPDTEESDEGQGTKY